MYEAKVLADSLSQDGLRLTTFEVEYPHAIHKDIMTHCQPDGTMVRVPDLKGHIADWQEVTIESLEVGDSVVTCRETQSSRSGMIRKRGNKITNISTRHFMGQLITVQSDGYVSRYTPEHPCVVLMKDVFDDKYVVYMMERKGYYKIGVAQGKTESISGNRGGFARCIIQEDADAFWILSVHSTREEANRQEQLYQHRFNIPGWCFRDLGHGILENPIWREILPNRAKASVALGRLDDYIEFPLWQRGQSLKFNQQAHVIAACNLIDGMRVLVADNARAVSTRQYQRLSIPHEVWTPITVGSELYFGDVISLEVENDHNYFADGILTHNCQLARNFQSMRAFPPEKNVERILADPFIPETFDIRVKGMGQGNEVGELNALEIRIHWMNYVELSIRTAQKMMEHDISKAQVNFVLQDLTSIRGIITATEWDNFWNLRLALNSEGKPMARPEVYKIVSMMKQAYDLSAPSVLGYDEWHVPLTDVNDNWCEGCCPDPEQGSPCSGCRRDWDKLKKLSTGRCARVSYLTHNGRRDPSKDIALHDGLKTDKHMSPFDHVAHPVMITGPKWVDEIDAATRKATGALLRGPDWRDKFYGWHSYRMDIEGKDRY